MTSIEPPVQPGSSEGLWPSEVPEVLLAIGGAVIIVLPEPS